MKASIAGSTIHGIALVVATNPDAAYQKLRKHLDEQDLGYGKDRELETVELIAEDCDYPDCTMRLFK